MKIFANIWSSKVIYNFLFIFFIHSNCIFQFIMAIRHDVVENCVGEDINASISTIKQSNAGFHQVKVTNLD